MIYTCTSMTYIFQHFLTRGGGEEWYSHILAIRVCVACAASTKGKGNWGGGGGEKNRRGRLSPSKINLKNTDKPEFIKEVYSKDLFLYPNKYQFDFFKGFCLNTP